jgi:hypothetical protein
MNLGGYDDHAIKELIEFKSVLLKIILRQLFKDQISLYLCNPRLALF